MTKRGFYEESQQKSEVRHWTVSAFLACFMTVMVMWLAFHTGTITPSIMSSLEYRAAGSDPQTRHSKSPVIPTNSLHGLRVSSRSIHELQNLLSTFEEAASVFITAADFTRNNYTHVYRSDMPDNEDNETVHPLITDSTKGNDRVFNILHGNIDCADADDLTEYVNSNLNAVKWICTVAIPPYAHTDKSFFGGFLTVAFLSKLTKEREDFFMTKMRQTARFIYEEDVQNNV